MSHPLISIIVPIYNVEDYLHRCIDSILGQSYPNIEVVLVDDGSPDLCGAICDEYKKADKRVVVIHRANGGLSAARNSGIAVCKGEYIGFVDSDDYISPTMYELLYNDIKTYNTLLAFCHTDVIRNGHSDNKIYGSHSEVKPKSYVMRRALEESIWWAAYTKLYHRSLFDDIRFPEGKVNEDLAIMMEIYDRCDNIAINYNKLYYYCIREDSITTSKLNSHKFDILDNAQHVAEYMHTNHPELETAARGILLSSALSLLTQLQQYEGHDLEEEGAKVLSAIRNSWPSLLGNPHLSYTQRALLSAASIHPSVMEACTRVRNCLKRIISQ